MSLVKLQLVDKFTCPCVNILELCVDKLRNRSGVPIQEIVELFINENLSRIKSLIEEFLRNDDVKLSCEELHNFLFQLYYYTHHHNEVFKTPVEVFKRKVRIDRDLNFTLTSIILRVEDIVHELSKYVDDRCKVEVYKIVDNIYRVDVTIEPNEIYDYPVVDSYYIVMDNYSRNKVINIIKRDYTCSENTKLPMLNEEYSWYMNKIHRFKHEFTTQLLS